MDIQKNERAASPFDLSMLGETLDFVPSGICVFQRREGAVRRVFTNACCARMLGLPQGELSGGALEEFSARVHPDDAERFRREIVAPLEQQGRAAGTFRICNRAENKYNWIHLEGRLIPQPDGDHYACFSYTSANSVMLAREQVQTAADRLIETINRLPSISALFLVTGKDSMRAVSFSDEFCRMVGGTKEEAWHEYSRDPFACVHPDDVAKVREAGLSGRAGTAPAAVVYRIRGLNRDYFWVSVRFSFFTLGEKEYLYAAYTDVDELKERELRLEKQYEDQLSYIDSISSGYVAAMRLNITRDKVETVSGTDPFFAPDGAASYTELLSAIASAIPRAQDRAAFLSEYSRDALLAACREGRRTLSLRYWFAPKGAHPCWMYASMNLVLHPVSGDVISFCTVKDISGQVIYQEISRQIVERNYETASYYDVDSGLYFARPIRGADGGDTPEGVPYGEVLEKALRAADPAEAGSLRRKFSMERIAAELEANPVYTIYYTKRQRKESLPGNPRLRMKDDIFYLDETRSVIVFLLADVTEVFEQDRENRQKMAEALTAAEQASVAKTEFLSRMSHEIRTPMNAIIGLDAIALQEQGLSAAMEDHLQKIGISARFLLSLINDILDMSRIESGRMMLKNEPFNFEELIGGINTILYEQCRDSELDYDCVLKSFTEETYVGDKTKLQQVLVNILGNAVKFTPPGGKVHFMVEQISRTKEKAKLRFEISDTGIGIDEKFLPHIFEPFSQENRGRTSAYGGTGLGLSISKNIVALMGGNITVHSIRNVGSEFTVVVELGLSTETIRRQRLMGKEKLLPLFTLIVDDDVIVCQHTQRLLSDAGLKAEWVDSGAGAVDKVTDQHRLEKDYDLILLDWKMPDMDGIETARRIRRIVGPDVTIIIMTAYDWTDIEKKARAAGVDMFMRKPVFASSVTKAFENVFLNKKDSAEPQTEPQYDFSGKRVLLAEDNDINAEIAKSILEMKHCAVDVAENGAIAIETFAASPVGHYDAILMDVRMPVMDGLDATRIIRAMKRADGKKVPILAMTANAFQEDVNMSLEAGMNAHLAKPIDPPALYATLDRYFSRQAVN